MEMLDTREKRVEKQENYLKECKTLICTTMNIAGPFKNSQLIKKAFLESQELTLAALTAQNIQILKKEVFLNKTGCEGYILVNEDSIKVKKIAFEVEESFGIGRLFDIDIIKEDGLKVSRKDIGAIERSCLICKKEGANCASSRTHSVEELQEYTINLICDYFNDKMVKNIAKNATRALLYEVSVSPKAGLVDLFDNGSHNDMNVFTFIDSSVTLYDYFEKCAKKAFEMDSFSPAEIFLKLRYLGIIAEKEMLSITKGVNTHKGAIFSLGILSAVFAYIYANEMENDIDTVLNLASEMAKISIHDFDNIKNPTTFGEKLFQTQKIKGIRGQAADGYKDIKNIGYPVMKRLLEEGKSYNDAGVITLMHLIASVEDTNIIKRSDLKTLNQVQENARNIIDKDADIILEMAKINEEYIQMNISPGGSADLLAMSFMIAFLID